MLPTYIYVLCLSSLLSCSRRPFHMQACYPLACLDSVSCPHGCTLHPDSQHHAFHCLQTHILLPITIYSVAVVTMVGTDQVSYRFVSSLPTCSPLLPLRFPWVLQVGSLYLSSMFIDKTTLLKYVAYGHFDDPGTKLRSKNLHYCST